MIDVFSAVGRAFRRAEAAVLAPSDIAWLAAFRVLFGLSMCLSMVRFIQYGWVDELFVRPSFRFKYFGFSWVEALPPGPMVALFWVLGGLALCVAAGFCFRAAALLFAFGFVYLELVDVTNYLNHYYLAGLLAFLLALSPAARAWSVSSWLWPERARTSIPKFWLYLLRLQVGVVYVYAGLAKGHADWLFHAQPLRIWLGSHGDFPLLGGFFATEWAPYVMSWAGFLFDTTIVAWLSWKTTRPFAYAAVVAFHVLTGALFPIGMFPVIMMLSALVFFAPDWPRRLAARVWRGAAGSVPPSPPLELRPSRLRTAGLALAFGYCAFELLMPLRFLAYGGNVRWHEQGMRFSWRVMVREKNGTVTFLVRSKRTGRVWHVSPARYLTDIQEREMSGQPDLILELAHHVRDDFERRGLGPVEVRAEALVSLNGRRLAPLIDPTVDLAVVQDGIGHARFILPAPDEPPPHFKAI
jgi:vitamin K-dependent gamma-carboxylase